MGGGLCVVLGVLGDTCAHLKSERMHVYSYNRIVVSIVYGAYDCVGFSGGILRA